MSGKGTYGFKSFQGGSRFRNYVGVPPHPPEQPFWW